MENYDYNKLAWKQDEHIQSRYKRQPAGGELIEDFWTFYVLGEQNLYLGTYASVSKPFDPQDLLRILRQAWICLRWDVPTIACQITHETSPSGGLPIPYMTYDSPTSAVEVEDWADKTVLLHSGYKDLDALRYVVEKTIMPPADLQPQTYIHLLPSTSRSFGILLQTSHVPFDGIASKIVMTKLYTILSRFVAEPLSASAELDSLQWGTGLEAKNLIPVAYSILRDREAAETDAEGKITKEEVIAEELEGPGFEKTLKDVLAELEVHKLLEHPFKSFRDPPYDPSTTASSTARVAHIFTEEESQLILRAKYKDSPDHLTVNQLLHGALCMVILLDNPPTEIDSTKALWFWGIANLRQRLKKEWRGTHDYPGYCIGISSMAIPLSAALPFPLNSKDYGGLVLELARQIRTEYKKQKEIKHLLAIHARMFDYFVNKLGPNMPIPAVSPWYAGDGRGEEYLSPKYTVGDQIVIEITDFFTGNKKTGPGPFFRSWEWNGRINLSVDFNEKAVAVDVMERSMKNWVELILAACKARE